MAQIHITEKHQRSYTTVIALQRAVENLELPSDIDWVPTPVYRDMGTDAPQLRWTAVFFLRADDFGYARAIAERGFKVVG